MGARREASGALFRLLSVLRAWSSLILRPVRSTRDFVECSRSFDPVAWGPVAERFDDGVGLAWRTLLPALLLALMGSLAPPVTDQLHANGGGLGDPIVAAMAPFASAAHSHSHSGLADRSGDPTFDASYLIRLGLLSLVSPAMIDAVHRIGPPLNQVRTRLRDVLRARKCPDDDARAELRGRVASGRALRRFGYDLYLPSMEQPPGESRGKDADEGQTTLRALLFLPGFGIDHASYSTVASKMSDAGLAVTVVSLEPLRLAHGSIGAGMGDVERLVRSAGTDICRHRRKCLSDGTSSSSSNTTPTTVEFSLSGHSMGGYAALQLASELVRRDSPLQADLPLTGCRARVEPNAAVWAAGPLVSSVPDLNGSVGSDCRGGGGKRRGARVLVLLGSNDNIAKFDTESQREELMAKLPRDKGATRVHTIKGGNHSGFASYERASRASNTYEMNGRRDMTLEEQHDEVARETVRFLMS